MKHMIKYVGIAFWLFAAIFLFLENIIKPDYSIDLFNQSAVAHNIANGFGPTVREVDPADISQELYVDDFTFAPGYTIVLASLIDKFDSPINLYSWSKFFLDILTLVFVFLVFKRFEVNNKLLLYLFMFFIVISKTILGGPTDLIAFSAFLLSALYFSNHFKEVGQIKIVHVFVLSFLAFLMGFFRYAYYPLTITYSVVFFLLFLKDKDWRWFKYAVINGVFVVLMLLPQLLYQMLKSSHISSIAENKAHMVKGFHAIHLLFAKPAFLSMFFDNIIVFRALGYEGLGGYDRGYDVPLGLRAILMTASISILIFLLVQLVKLIKNNSKNISSIAKFLFMAVAIGATIKYLFLLAISVYYPSAYPNFIWTHAMIGRYYNIVFIAVLLVIFLILQHSDSKIVKGLIYLVFGTSVLFHTAHKSYLFKNYSLTNPIVNTNIRYPPDNYLEECKGFYKKLKLDEQEFAAYIYGEKEEVASERIMLAYMRLADIPTLLIRDGKPVSSSKEVLILSDMTSDELESKTNLIVEKVEVYYRLAPENAEIYSYKVMKE